jgi:dipeptide/tripeptide permease
VLYGGIMITAGNTLLVFHGLPNFYGGLACIVVGVGMLKPNISVIVGQLYSAEDKRRDAGFSIFYMGINIGATLAPLACGWLAQNEHFKTMLTGWGIDPRSCWHWGFGAAAFGMFLGLVQYVLTGKQLGSAGLHPTPPANAEVARRNRRTLTIGVVGVAAVAVALLLFDCTAHYYDTIAWRGEGGGLAVDASTADNSEQPMHLRGGAPIAVNELGDVLGADALGVLRREVFRQRVAAGQAKGSTKDYFQRIAETAAEPADGTPVPVVRINALQWTDIPGGVRVVGSTVDGAREVALDDLAAATVDKDPPKRLAKAGPKVLETVLADAVKSGATKGSLAQVHVKVGGLNEGNVHKGFSVALALIVIFVFGRLFLAGQWTAAERARLVTIFVLFCGASIFWGIFEQAGSTLTLFADRSTDNSIFGLRFDSSNWQSVNALLIVLLAPLFAWLWLRLGTRNPSYPTKFAVGLLFAGLGFLLLVGGAMFAKGGREVSPLWLLGVYLLHTIGELCLSPVGLSSMTKLAPARVVSLMMGVWFLAASVGNFIGGSVAGFYESFELPTLFGMVAASGILMALLMFALVIPIKRMMERNAEPAVKA